MNNLIEKFSSVNSLKTNLEREIEDTESKIQEYSNLLGEKIRINEEASADDPDFIALKEKFGGETSKKSDDKKSDDKKSDDKKSDDKKSDYKKLKDNTKEIKNKTKRKNKKSVSDKWYNLNEILVYNGIGLKGELELYFKAVDELKEKLENLQRCLSTLNTVIEKGLKKDMGCVAFRGSEGIIEIAFLKSSGVRENFSLKSIYSGKAISIENSIKIGI